MSELNHRPEPDILDQATEALRDAPVPAGPPADLTAATVAAVESQTAAVHRTAERRRTIMRYVRYGSLATAAAVLLGVFWVAAPSAVALDKAIDKAAKAEIVRYEVTTSDPGSPFAGPKERTDAVTIRGKQVRMEGQAFPKRVFVIDRELNGMLIVSPPNTTYQTVDLAAKTGVIAPFDAFSVNLREQLQQLKKQKAELEATEKVGGVLSDKLTVAGGKALGLNGDWEVWIDRKTQYPVKIRVEQEVQGRTLTRVYEKFEWNPKVADASFRLDPPEGYTEGTVFQTFPPLAPYKPKK